MQSPEAYGTDLVYNLMEHSLYGSIDGEAILARAVSGGRAGSKLPNVINQALANNPFLTHVKKSEANPGGAIPMRKFYLKIHESRENWIRLLPLKGQDLGGRAGFAIHGRGSRGSDGCIVPTDFHNVLLIHRLVGAREKKGLAPPTLAVIAVGDFSMLVFRV